MQPLGWIETLGVVSLVGMLFYQLGKIESRLAEMLKELKGLRFQLQETFTPEDIEGGHFGHPKATHQLVHKILKELQQIKLHAKG